MNDYEHTVIYSVETADLVKENKKGTFFWHVYDPEDPSVEEKFSISYPSMFAAEQVWPNNVSWEKQTMCKQDSVWNNNNVQFARLLAEIAAVDIGESVWDELCVNMDLESDQLSELFDRAQCAFEKNKLEICPPENVQVAEQLREDVNAWANNIGTPERRYPLEDDSVLCVKLGDDGIVLDVEDDLGRCQRTNGLDIDTLDSMCK